MTKEIQMWLTEEEVELVTHRRAAHLFEEVYHRGFCAAMMDCGEDSNPFSEDSKAHLHWLDGFNKGQNEK